MKTSTVQPKNLANATTTIVENKYKPGDVVYERIRPFQKLIVGRYAASLYYCKDGTNPKRKELVYFERELMDNPSLIMKKVS